MHGFPWKWSIYSWLDGETSASGHIADLCEFAVDLAKFLEAFQSIDSRELKSLIFLVIRADTFGALISKISAIPFKN